MAHRTSASGRSAAARLRRAGLSLLTAFALAFAALAPAPAAASTPAPLGCSTASDPLPSSTTRRPVVYVHGWTANAKSLDNASRALQSALGDTYQVLRFDYGTMSTTWPVGTSIADCLAQYLRTAADAYQGGTRGAIAVGHSMAGIAMRAAAKVLTDAGNADALIGIVTIATPHKGTPMGDNRAAELLQTVKAIAGAVAGDAEAPPLLGGSNAAHCLGVDAGCLKPPYIQGDQRIATIGTQIVLEHRMFGMKWLLKDSQIPVFGDAIVPLPSSTGYFDSGPGAYTTTQMFGSQDFTCLESQSALATAAKAVGLSGVDDVLHAVTDPGVADSFRTSRFEPIQLEYTVTALFSQCSHLNVLTYPPVVQKAADYVRAMVAAAERPAEQRALDRRRWLYEITTADADGTGGQTDALFGDGQQEHAFSTAQALGCRADAPVSHEYDLGGTFQSLTATVGNRLGSDPTLVSHWSFDADGSTTEFDLTGRSTMPVQLDLSGVKKLTITAAASGGPSSGEAAAVGCSRGTPVGVLGNAYLLEVNSTDDGSGPGAGAGGSSNLAAKYGWPTNRHDSNGAFYIWLGAASAWGTVKMGMVDWLACDAKQVCIAGTENEVLVTYMNSGGRQVAAEFTASEPAVDKLKSLNASDQELKELLQ